MIELSLDWQTCARTSDGQVLCWGGNQCEKCASCPAPKAILGLPIIRKIAVGRGFACALSVDGDVYCWGENHGGQLGDGTTVSRVEPAPVVW